MSDATPRGSPESFVFFLFEAASYEPMEPLRLHEHQIFVCQRGLYPVGDFRQLVMAILLNSSPSVMLSGWIYRPRYSLRRIA